MEHPCILKLRFVWLHTFSCSVNTCAMSLSTYHYFFILQFMWANSPPQLGSGGVIDYKSVH